MWLCCFDFFCFVCSQEYKRCLSPQEAFTTHGLPVTQAQAAKSGAPMLNLDGVSSAQAILAAGNCMSLPCIGAMILCAAMGLTKVD